MTRRQPVVIFINPKSGKGFGPRLFQEVLRPQLEQRGISYRTIETSYRGHAKSFVIDADLSTFSGFICISGDGLIHEIYQGLYERADWHDVAAFPIGLIPGGSGCALNCSLLKELECPLEGLNNPGLKASAINCAEGAETAVSTPLDLIEVEFKKEKVVSFLGVTVGVIADADLGSEWMRFLGQIRSYLYVAARILCPKPYTLRISFLPLKLDANDKPIPVTLKDPPLSMPSLSSPVPSNWVTVEEPFHFVYALNVPLLDSVTNLAPDSKLGDGVLWMVLVRNSLSFIKIIQWFSNPSDGPDTSDPGLDVIPIRAFRIEPVHPLDGYLSLDAESYPFETVQGQIVPQKARIMAAKEHKS